MPNIRFHENVLSYGSRVFHADRGGRTDKYEAANSRFSQFFEHT